VKLLPVGSKEVFQIKSAPAVLKKTQVFSSLSTAALCEGGTLRQVLFTQKAQPFLLCRGVMQ